MKYLGFLHSCNQNQPWANSILIRVMWEDISEAELYGYDWKKAVYGDFSDRKEERGLIYPNKETYSEWAKIGSNYKNVFLSINFDIYPKDKRQKFINFVTEVVDFFYLHNKNIIVGAGNEPFEKRRTAQKVLEVVSDVSTGIYRAHKNLPICFWNQAISTTDEKEALKILIEDPLTPEFCKYFGFQSLSATPETSRKYIKLAKEKGLKSLDVECGTKTVPFSKIKMLVDNDVLNEVEGVWIMCPEIRDKLRKAYKIWGDYALRVLDDEDENFVIVDKDKRRIINYAKKFLEKEKEKEQMKLVTYKKWSRGLPIEFVQRAINAYVVKFFAVANRPDWYPLDIDGIFGPLTESGIEWYQNKEVLTISKVVDKETMSELAFDFPKIWSCFCVRYAYGER